MIAANPDIREVTYVCRNLRPASQAEMFLLSDVDPATLARVLIEDGMSWVAYDGDVPAAVIGAYPMHPGVWGLYGCGTEHYGRIMLEVTRFARRVMMPAVKATGAHRAQCFSPVGHDETHKWLRLLGAKQEGVMRGYGKNGEDVAIFAWTKGD